MKRPSHLSEDVLGSRRWNVTLQDPSVKTADPEAVTSIETSTLEDSHVYVHCHINGDGNEMLIRIWNTTFLIDHVSGLSSAFIHAENISIAPQWTRISGKGDHSFLLIFSGLPKACLKFDLKEDIPQPGGFFVADIPRNESDVYHVTLL